MSTSSARPDNMRQFTTAAPPATHTLSQQINALVHDAEAFHSPDESVNALGVISTLQSFVKQNGEDERFVHTVMQAFLAADSGTIPDSVIAARLAQEGIGQAVPGVPTIDDPSLSGLPMSSGWSDDPVCMATGHFVEVETDMPMPASLGLLAWSRTYNSRFITGGPLGRGWSSWASTSLVEHPDGTVEYRGPDGQVAVWVTVGGGFVHNPGVAAEVRRAGDGLELCWQWRSRHQGAVWSFDGEGRILTLRQPGLVPVHATYDGPRLVGMRRDGGRSITIEWDGERIGAVASSDGRRVAYSYLGDDLCEAARPAGTARYRSDAAGRILEVSDADGVRLVRNEYDDAGRVLVQESALGRRTHFDYLGRLTVLVRDEHDGPRTLFRHDILGRLVELTTAEGTRLVRDYDPDGNPVRVTGLAGDETLRRFDPAGNLTWQRDAAGVEETFDYDGLGRLVRRTDGTGAVWDFAYDGDGMLPCRVAGPLGWHVEYRVADGLLAGITDADGVSWEFELDVDGQVVAVVDGAGGRTAVERHPSGEIAAVVSPTGSRHQVTRDDAGRPLAVHTASGDLWRADWSDAGRLRMWVGPAGEHTEMRYGADGQLAAVVDPLGGETSLSWDLWGNLAGSVEPGGARWEFGYDGLCRPVSITDPTGAVWVQHWDPAGRFAGVEDPTGYLVRREIDPSGLVRGIHVPGAPTRELSYDGAGRLAAVTAAGETLASVERDALGRVVAATDGAGRRVRYSYSSAGRVVEASDGGAVWRYGYDSAGRLVRATGPGGEERGIEYDPAGRVVAVTEGGERRCFAWDDDGRLVAVTGPDGATTRYRWSAGDRLVALERPDGSVVSYDHDPAGRVRAVTDPLGGRTEVRRAPGGQPVEVTDAKGATWRWELDAAGRPVAATDPLGRRQVLERDASGAPVSWAAAGEAPVDLVWGDDGDLGEIRRGGEVVWQARPGPDGAVTYTGAGGASVTEVRDGAGRLVRREEDGRVTTWRWDDDARAMAVTTPAGDTIEYRFDEAGRTAAVLHPALGEVRLEHDGAGRVTALRAAGLTREWGYDRGHLISYRERRAGTVTEVSLERDAMGRVVREERDGAVRRFAYDAAGQMVSCDGPDGAWRWEYDSCGRLTVEHSPLGERRFAYDDADQLLAVRDGDGEVRYRWDGAGRRVAAEYPDGEVAYRWDTQGRLVGVVDGRPGGRSRDLRVGPTGVLEAADGVALDWDAAGREVLAAGERTIVSAAGSPVAVVGPGEDGGRQASVVGAGWRGDLSDDPLPLWGPSGAGGANPELGFLGEVELGPLVWLRNRVYDGATHSFLSRDPLSGLASSPGGLTNPYAYAGNDPLGFVDPLGLKPMSVQDYNHWRSEEQNGCWKTVLAWTATAVIVAGSVALIAASGGAAVPLLAAVPEALAPVMTGAGLGGLFGVGGSAFDQAIHGAPIDPVQLATNGVEGMIVGGATAYLGPAIGSSLVDDAAGAGVKTLAKIGGTMGVSGAMTAAQSAGNQEFFNHRVDLGTVATAGGAGVFAGAVPGFDVNGAAADTVFPGLKASQAAISNVAVGIHGNFPAASFAAATDNGSPAPGAPPPDMTKIQLVQKASLKPASYYLASAGSSGGI